MSGQEFEFSVPASAFLSMEFTPPSSAVEIRSPADSSLVVRIKYDGTVEFGAGITPDQAAAEFWKAVSGFVSTHLVP